MDKFQEMLAFTAVVDAGSFVRAAEAMHLSKTAVSRLLSELELRLGVRLLHRTTRTLSLTREGEIFHERCKELLASLQEAEAEISLHAGEAIGHLRVSAPISFGRMHLAPLWPRFMAMHPKVALEVTLADRLVDLVEEGYDLAVRIAQLPSSTLVTRQLTSTRLVLCASPDYLKRRGTPLHPSDLVQHDAIAYTLLATGDLWEFDGPDGRISVKVKPSMRSNSGDTSCAAALLARGIALEPDFLVGAHLKSGALVEVLPEYRSHELGVYAVYPSRKHLTPKVRALIDYLVAAFESRDWAG